jgi:hypothetical protein
MKTTQRSILATMLCAGAVTALVAYFHISGAGLPGDAQAHHV